MIMFLSLIFHHRKSSQNQLDNCTILCADGALTKNDMGLISKNQNDFLDERHAITFPGYGGGGSGFAITGYSSGGEDAMQKISSLSIIDSKP